MSIRVELTCQFASFSLDLLVLVDLLHLLQQLDHLPQCSKAVAKQQYRASRWRGEDMEWGIRRTWCVTGLVWMRCNAVVLPPQVPLTRYDDQNAKDQLHGNTSRIGAGGLLVAARDRVYTTFARQYGANLRTVR